MMKDYDLRQLHLMTEQLDAYGRGAMDLGALVSRLDGLQNALPDAGASWRNEFSRQWGVLEDVYADSLDKNLKEIPMEHMSLVGKAIQEIRRLVSERILRAKNQAD